VTEGLPASEATARLRELGTPELPADPTGEQLDAWLELAELAADEDFQRTTRANTLWGAEAVGGAFDPAFRRWLVEQLDAHTDPRAERHRRLVGIVQGRPDEEFAGALADHAWPLAALRHHRDCKKQARQ
jgi:hypothetical protein